MTSVAIWAGVDTRGPASLYIASDSRLSWGGGVTWDQGRKVFSSMSKPHIFGYWGDVLFPALTIPVIVDRIDRGLLCPADERWHVEVQKAIRRLWADYPESKRRDFGIAHGFRTDAGIGCVFNIAITSYEHKSDTWETRESSDAPEICSTPNCREWNKASASSAPTLASQFGSQYEPCSLQCILRIDRNTR